MELETYRSITTFIKRFKGSSRECKKKILKEYPELPENTLCSIIGTEWQYKMMRNHFHVRKISGQLYDRYKSSSEAGEEPGILIRLASELDFSPSQLAKLILEHHYQKKGESDVTVSKKDLQRLMKDTSLIEDCDLAFETYLTVLEDDQCGPYSDQIKNLLGCEYEIKLQERIKKIGLVFKTEKDLSAKGYDKTPDIKLDIPVAVNGFVINWIESKALFGSERQHEQYTKEQYRSYWNRFGPGLVIYWYSYVKTIIDPLEKRFIVRDNLPAHFTFLDPDLIPAPTFSSGRN